MPTHHTGRGGAQGDQQLCGPTTRPHPDEGTGTDLPSAIRQGVNDLTDGTDDSEPLVLFLLSDGEPVLSRARRDGH